MRTRLIAILLLLTACGPGLIPCPVVELPTYKQASAKRKPTSALVVKSEEEPKSPYAKTSKTNDRYVSNVTLEEWDCPRPGDKKYMPKKIKQNIRKNWQKIQSTSTDSLGRTQPH